MARLWAVVRVVDDAVSLIDSLHESSRRAQAALAYALRHDDADADYEIHAVPITTSVGEVFDPFGDVSEDD
jgi:hypothetical protein